MGAVFEVIKQDSFLELTLRHCSKKNVQNS